MLVSDLRLKSKKELNNLINDLKAELFMLRFKNSTGQLDQPHKISVIKKDIAKVFTVLYEQEKGIVISTNKKNLIKKDNKLKKETKKIEVKTQKVKNKENIKVGK